MKPNTEAPCDHCETVHCIPTAVRTGIKSLRELQTSLPWTIRYSRDFRANPQPHKDFTHALLHVAKALGHLTGLADDMDHDREVADNKELREQYGKYVADLVVCALRAANTFPGGVLDLEKAVIDRIQVKNFAPKEVEEAKVKETPRSACNAFKASKDGKRGWWCVLPYHHDGPCKSAPHPDTGVVYSTDEPTGNPPRCNAYIGDGARCFLPLNHPGSCA